jgi:carboxyl-terminal processing protease
MNAHVALGTQVAVAELERRGATELVLDLSDNRGGLVNEGVEIARMFLPPGAIVFITKGVASDMPTLVPPAATPTGCGQVTELPLTIVVNANSASASEILAGALRDNCRATIAGKATFGKGLIQSVYELSDASGMAVTVGKYLTPSGADIDRRGITPDSPALLTPAAAERVQRTCSVPVRAAA